jgi:hypothetical protein
MARLSARQLQRNAFLAKWSRVDWSRQNCELAVEMGLSGERIRQIRKQLGAPQPTHPDRKRITRQTFQWAKDNLDNLKGLTWAELGRRYGLGDYWKRSPLYSFLKPFLRDGNHIRKHPWGRMNFWLPNRDLARIWRLQYTQMASGRTQERRSRARWRYKPGSGGIHVSGRGRLQAYQRALKAEEQKAARHFAQAAERKAGGRAA